MKARLAIIGVGKWGKSIVRTVSESESLQLIAAVTSKSRVELQEIAPFDGVVYQDYEELTQLKSRLDGVVVATPAAVREPIVDYFLDSGVPVFAEKPLSLNASETNRLIEKSRRTGVRLVKDFIHLYV